MTNEQTLVARAIAGALADADTSEATKAITDVGIRVANAMLNADPKFQGVAFLSEALR